MTQEPDNALPEGITAEECSGSKQLDTSTSEDVHALDKNNVDTAEQLLYKFETCSMQLVAKS